MSYIFCEEAKEIVGNPDAHCCGSCHSDEDDDLGYEMLGGGLAPHKDREWYVCCTVCRAVEKFQMLPDTTTVSEVDIKK